MAMKTIQSVAAALLGVAMLAMPISASAHTHYQDSYRGAARPYQAYRPVNPAVNFRTNLRMAPPVAPSLAMTNRYYAPNRFDGPNRFYAPATAYVPPRYYGYAAPTPPVYAAAAAPNCPIGAPAYYQQPSYGYMPPAYMPPAAMSTYGAAMTPGLASMVNQRNSAEYLYRLALQRGNGDRAHHLANDISQLNKNIANARWHSGVGPAYGSLNPMSMNRAGYGPASPLASNYGTGYGYNNYSAGYPNSGLGSMLGPVLGGFIH
jgi:hypothetical protein